MATKTTKTSKHPGISQRVTSTGEKRWHAAYRAADGRERTSTFGLLKEAEAWRRDQLNAMDKGSWIDPRDIGVTFGEVAESWRSSAVHRPTTAALVAGLMANHALPVFGHLPLSSVRPSTVQAWVRGLSEKLAPSTSALVFSYVSSVFTAAVKDGLLARNPCIGTRLPRRARPQVVPMSAGEVLALIDAMPERLRTAAVLGAGAGLRQGEVTGLTVDRIDFLRRQLTVDRQLLSVAGQPPTLAPPKTPTSDRVVPLGNYVLSELARHLERFEPGVDGLLFTSTTGRPIHRSRFAEAFRTAATSAGLPASVSFHDCRHFYASTLIHHGESVKVVQARLGHSSAVETLDVYSHLFPVSEDSSRRAVDDVLSAAPADMSADLRATAKP